MTVITCKDEDFFSEAGGRCRCTQCGRLLQYPFLEWHGFGTGGIVRVYFCSGCCLEIERGLTADLRRINHVSFRKMFPLMAEEPEREPVNSETENRRPRK